MNPTDRRPLIAGLQALAAQTRAVPLRTLFADDAGRVPRFTVEGAGLTLDLSRQRIDPACLSALLDYAAAVRFDDRRAALLRGDIVNPTEGRRAL